MDRREVHAYQDRRDGKFKIPGSKFRKLRTSDLEPSSFRPIAPFSPVSRVTRKNLFIVQSHSSQAGACPIVASHRALQAQPRADLSLRSVED